MDASWNPEPSAEERAQFRKRSSASGASRASRPVSRCSTPRPGRPEAVAELYREDGALALPGLARPLGGGEIAAGYRRLAALLGGARLAPRSWAGDDALLFVEWEGRIHGSAGPFWFGAVERFDLLGGRALAARWYFETGALARALAT
jgi:hypothetical protein